MSLNCDGTKKCPKCLKSEPEVFFRKNQGYCSVCQDKYCRAWSKSPRGKAITRERHYRNREVNSKRASWRRIKRELGLGPEDYDRMYAEQGGVCAICKQPERGDSNVGGVKRMSIDHDHATGKIRSLLCAACNTRLGILENDDFVKSAIAYLAGHGKTLGNFGITQPVPSDDKKKG